MTTDLLSVQDRDVLAFWDVGELLTEAAPALGTVNKTVLLQMSAGPYVLRISCRGAARTRWEHACIAWAADHGLPVCRPIPLRGGGTVLERHGLCYALFPFARGSQIAQGDLRADHAGAAGECLGRIHDAFLTFPIERARIKNVCVDMSASLASVPRIENAIQALPVQSDTEHVALEQLAARRDWLEQCVHLAEGLVERLADLPQCMLHGDYQETNLFFEDGSITAVIDWDQSGVAARGWEAVRAMHMMFAVNPELCRSFLHGYRCVLDLPEGELQHAAACYGMHADSNLWVYQAAYLERNERAKQFIKLRPFVPFHVLWERAGLHRPQECDA